MPRFLVTGGAGFIGSHITELLLSEGHEVVIYDDFSTGCESNIQSFRGKVTVFPADIRDTTKLRQAMAAVEYVLHHAAEVSAIRSVEEPLRTNDVNVTGTLNILVCAREAGVKRVVFASSSAVYGDTGTRPQSETDLPSPLSPYGATKLCAEHYLSVYHDTFGLDTVRLRYFNVFGPRQNPKSQYAAVIPRFIDRILAGQELRIYGDGQQTRDFVYVKDVARANYVACLSDKTPGEVFNIAGGRSVTINELASLLMELTGKRVPITHDSPVAGEIRYSASVTRKARDVLGFTPRTSFERGLGETLDFLRQ